MKLRTQPTGISMQEETREEYTERVNEPLSGSKKVKNRNHSRNNHGEGS
ncbi:small acid-soluble spore protein P [Paenibacillus larvae]|uniref:Small acid-soluble spore protein P n=3 Tax=Paenibacillus larvae TaxID=1464 RepID=V9W423_9BACL|nr:small acid-soluble spore protein P [Paenibacillus larvae]AHD03897.1 hypothetical protein ERIC2_c00182 [Paenibacillus larvae subsp. larvae DSM 25430]AQR78690.1 hypothetical protein BXP28_16845 [Paenibacillus larvae subsp. larvae]AVF20036.1 acid-soluble spore protein P [Paenibacillus larvae subsp. larvae]AVG10502.1 acid-soluble spore protein P [Paenibacillus larvae subsp. larvae DSM 25430]ETK29126.1 hypothetical protein ERIC1_1c26290 [Paenibacillus larvae subsp. larvae DSM 25719]